MPSKSSYRNIGKGTRHHRTVCKGDIEISVHAFVVIVGHVERAGLTVEGVCRYIENEGHARVVESMEGVAAYSKLLRRLEPQRREAGIGH